MIIFGKGVSMKIVNPHRYKNGDMIFSRNTELIE